MRAVHACGALVDLFAGMPAGRLGLGWQGRLGIRLIMGQCSVAIRPVARHSVEGGHRCRLGGLSLPGDRRRKRPPA